MKEKVKLVEKYNLWNGKAFPIGYVRESYVEKIYRYLLAELNLVKISLKK